MNDGDELAPEAHRDYLRALARLHLFDWLGARLDASDVVQETLLRAREAQDQFRGTTAAELRAWLRTILSRVLLNAARHHGQAKRDARNERRLDASLDESSRRLDAWLAADQTSPSQGAARSERLARLAAALDELPPAQRAVILLKHAEGCPVAEIGLRLGLTTAAVAGLLRRGLQRLRECLAEDTEVR
jgi:RNA polymerase sigma-70 factor (ECF subfamily)